MDTITKGSRVRSFDFEHSRDCYVEGVVVGFDDVEDCPRYVLKVDRDVFDGQEIPAGERGSRVGRVFFPPVNGTPKLFGGVCDGVEEVR